MKNNIVKILENFIYLLAICIGAMLVYWMVVFSYVIISSVYQALIK